MDRTRAIVIGVSGAFLALVLVAFLRVGAERSVVQREAPDFTLPKADGTDLVLRNRRGRAVLVNFWATWCPPCIDETPSLEALHRRLGPRGLDVVGVSVDDGWEAVRPFVERFGVTYTIVLDPSAGTARRFGTFKYPESYLVDPTGLIARKWVGALDWSAPEVLAEIERSLPTADAPFPAR